MLVKGVPQCKHMLFLVRVFFSFKEKCPTLTVTFSFLQTTDLTLIGPLFREPPETINAKSGQCKLSAKGPSFGFFSTLCDFFPKFF